MSTTAYEIMDAIRTAMASSYPTKSELANRVDLESNTDHILKNGYDVIVGAATNEGELRGRGISTSRDMAIVLTKSFIESDLKNDIKQSTEETLFQEIVNICSLLKTDSTIGGKVLDLEIDGDSGIEVLNADKLKILTSTINFTIRYVEIY